MNYGADGQRELAAALRAVTAGTGGTDLASLLGAAVRGGLMVAAGAAGCSVTEIARDGYRTLVYAGAAAMALDLLQYETGRGPCLSAAREQRSYLADDPAALGRWLPGWTAAAARHGVASVLSLPLPGPSRPAGINFYGTRPATFRPAAVTARAALISRLAGAALDRHPDAAASPATPGAVQAAESQRALLARARAAVARADGLTEAEAFTRLALRSAREDRSIGAVARDALAALGQPEEEQPR